MQDSLVFKILILLMYVIKGLKRALSGKKGLKRASELKLIKGLDLAIASIFGLGSVKENCHLIRIKKVDSIWFDSMCPNLFRRNVSPPRNVTAVSAHSTSAAISSPELISFSQTSIPTVSETSELR